MTVFVTGGCKNGKSTYALRQAAAMSAQGPRYYIATLVPGDDEQWKCVQNHRAARCGMGFATLECPTGVANVADGRDTRGVFLLDSVTALLNNEMFASDGTMDADAPSRVIRDLERFLNSVRHAVVVSDYIYSDGMGYSETTRAFGRALAEIDSFLAQKCERVVEICGGIPTVHKDIAETKQYEGLLCI